jgi:hypothetical protein
MARELHTADEIRAEVKRLFDPHGTRRKRVPHPERIANPEPGEANWRMPLIRSTDMGVQFMFSQAVQDVRARWDLKE